ncbi:MAG: FkbM family methyltransferase [Gemmatimonadota bacterium]|nr:MAG: FkbM family methyltransferase [Gemmatimonadota bacterium]
MNSSSDLAPAHQLGNHPSAYSDLRASKRLNFLHLLEHKPLAWMKANGIPGAGMIRRIARLAAPLPRVSGPAVVKTNLGVSMLVDPTADPTLERPLFELGVYEAGTLRVLSELLQEGDVFVDVGANIGLITLAASLWVGQTGTVLAVEPVPRNYDVLNYNVALNDRKNIRTYRCALGSGPGMGKMYERPGVGWVGTSLVRTSDSSAAHEVTMSSLDALIEQSGQAFVSVVKIDVEGWELEVLRGAVQLLSREKAPAIVIEYSRLNPMQGGEPIDIYGSLLESNPYRVYKLARGKWAPSKLIRVEGPEQLPEHDNLFFLLDSHCKRLPARMFA